MDNTLRTFRRNPGYVVACSGASKNQQEVAPILRPLPKGDEMSTALIIQQLDFLPPSARPYLFALVSVDDRLPPAFKTMILDALAPSCPPASDVSAAVAEAWRAMQLERFDEADEYLAFINRAGIAEHVMSAWTFMQHLSQLAMFSGSARLH